MRKLRVGFITPALYWGGAERWMLDLARLSTDRLDWVGIATVQSVNRDATMASLFEQIMPVYEYGPEAVAKLLPKADVLIAWGVCDLRELTAGFAGPIVFVGHGQGQFDHHAASAAVPGATHFAAVARAAVPPIVAAGVPEERIAVLYNGIDPERCRQTSTRAATRHKLDVADEEFLVAYVGRLVPEKAPQIVARAVAKLQAVAELSSDSDTAAAPIQEYRAVFVGDGWAMETERAAIQEVLPDALFTGRVENVGDYYAAADCFALASPREGFSMGMLEAMYCGVPCALTRVGVLPELETQHGRHWESIEPGRRKTPVDLAHAIRRIAEMPAEERIARAQRCQAIVEENYLARQMADRWIEHLATVVGNWKLEAGGTLEAGSSKLEAGGKKEETTHEPGRLKMEDEPKPTDLTNPTDPPDRASTSLTTDNGQLATNDCPFERAYVINLRRRPDRKKAFFDRLAKADWPTHWPQPEVYEAIDGDRVGVPPEFQHGGGAYGCRMSHLRILQDCLMEGIDGVLVFEDDAELTPGIGSRLAEFFEKVPDDWEGIMPGGQHHAPPGLVKGHPEVVRVNNAQRTHCYIARRRYLRGLQQRWGNSQQHIDWRMKDFHNKYRVYAPQEWLVGQCGGRSDVYNGQKPPEWWNDPKGPEPVLLLEAPREVMEELRQHGFHSGMRRNRDGIDVGLVDAYGQKTASERKAKLAAWVRCLHQECCGGWIATVWHPKARVGDFQGLAPGGVFEIAATTVDEALEQLPERLRARLEKSLTERRPAVVLLDAPREAFERLLRTGFHGGYWRHTETGIDNGLRRIYSGPEDPGVRAEALKKWCKELLTEADRDGLVLTVWHPGAVPMGELTAEKLAEASGRRVIPIRAGTAEEARKKWEES